MIILSGTTAAVLCGLALLHALWAARIWWPFADETALARAVAGFPGMTAMPNALSCLVVALFLSCAALFVLDLGGVLKSGFREFEILGGLVLAGIFLARGVVGYLPFWSRLTPEQPFRSLDLAYYSPLCLALGVSIAILLVGFISSSRG